MKAINYIISTIQTIIVVLYIMFYNVQYFWSLKSTIMNLIDIVLK